MTAIPMATAASVRSIVDFGAGAVVVTGSLYAPTSA